MIITKYKQKKRRKKSRVDGRRRQETEGEEALKFPVWFQQR
jgi:hypothetical protein